MHLKKIPPESVGHALEKARHYRVLNEPNQAESICLDILEVEPENQEALSTLILALSDQFERRLAHRFHRAKDLLEQLTDEYSRRYYEGIICERRARAQLRRGGVRVGPAARDWLDRAMDSYERASELTDRGNPDALLRWNTCARMILERAELREEESAVMTPEVMGE
jgi:hypothetical protein